MISRTRRIEQTTVNDHDLQLPPLGRTKKRFTTRRPGEMTALLGLGGLFVSVSSVFADLFVLPAWSQGAVAGASGALLAIGTVQRRTPPAGEATRVNLPTDLPTLTGEIANVLARLRLEHGLAYRSSTWVDEVLPRTGVPVEDPALVRDLIAVCALDAGGVRADTTTLLSANSRERLVQAAMGLLDGLQRVLTSCSGRGSSTLPSSDPTRWPA
jgi:hypothetical protein